MSRPGELNLIAKKVTKANLKEELFDVVKSEVSKEKMLEVLKNVKENYIEFIVEDVIKECFKGLQRYTLEIIELGEESCVVAVSFIKPE